MRWPISPLSYVQCKAFHLNGVQTELKCKPNVKRCKRFVFVGHSPLLHHNTLKTKAITLFQADHILTRFVFPPLYHPLHHRTDLPRSVPVGHAPTDQIADNHSESCQYHQRCNAFRTKTGNLGQQRGDVAIPAEYATVAQSRSSQYEPRRRLLQKTELSFKSRVFQSFDLRYPTPNVVQCYQSPGTYQQKRGTPRQCMAQRSTQRHPKQIGHSHSRYHN